MAIFKQKAYFWSLVVALSLIFAFSVAQDFSKIEVQSSKVTDSVYMLYAGGGNLGVLMGDEGALVVDTSFAEMYDKIKAAIQKIDDAPVRYVILTHQHFDHVNGNELFAQSGATIIAHEKVRSGMEGDWVYPGFQTVPAYPQEALPVITYNESLTFHFNDEEIRIFHPGPAHSSGDSIVHFRTANVVHMGDLFFNGGYPFIDVPHGGTIEGIIAALDHVIEMTDDATKVIPGHGPLSNRGELKIYRDMLAAIKERVETMIKAGKTLEEVIAAKPTADFDRAPQIMMPPDTFVQILYEDLSRK